MTRTWFVDLDGVLADFQAHCQAIFGIDSRDPALAEMVIEHLKSEKADNFFANVPVMADALELWNGIKHLNPVILTGVPKDPVRFQMACSNKIGWVRKHISTTAEVICCLSSQKKDFGKPGDILIDDWTRFQSKWEKMGGIFIVHTSAQDTLEQVKEYL